MDDCFRKYWFDGVLPNMWSPSVDDVFVPQTLSVASTHNLWNQFIERKQNYIKKVISEIQSQRNLFLSNLNKINKDIQDAISLLKDTTLKNEQVLKTKLLSITEEKNKKWSFQLETCEKALVWLQTLRQDAPPNSLTAVQAFDKICNRFFIRDIEITEKGEIKLDNEDLGAFKVLQNLSRIFETSFLKPSTPAIPKFIIGGSNDRRAQFCRPWGVCSDVQGRILVCDRSNDRVVVFDNAGQFIFEFGKTGAGKGEFSRPAGITVYKTSRIIVCDKDNHRIQVFDFYGKYLFDFGQFGTEKGQFNYPWDVAANAYGEIAVTDSKNHRVQLFSCNGVFITEYRSKGFDLPRGVAFKPDGRLLVTDFNNHKVVLLNKSFKRLRTYCREGSTPGRLFRPQGISCLKNGCFAVSDSKNFRVQIFDEHGQFINSIGTEGSEPGQFNCPQGISYHPDGNLIVVDLSNNRVQVFGL